MSLELEQKVKTLESRLELVEQRNKRVELNKSWETSFTRKISILVLTYLVMCLVFFSLGNHPAWLNAVIPTLGFFLSTMSLPVIRGWWKKNRESQE